MTHQNFDEKYINALFSTWQTSNKHPLTCAIHGVIYLTIMKGRKTQEGGVELC